MAEIRIRNGFADRNKFNEIDSTIQIKDFSYYSRVAIKNKIIELFGRWEKQINDHFKFRDYVVSVLCNDVFCIPLDSEEANFNNVTKLVNECIDGNPYYDVLSIVEYLANKIYLTHNEIQINYRSKIVKTDLCEEFNELFENECIGYRFIDGKIVEITNLEEIKEISNALNSPYEEKVNVHLKKSLQSLSETGKKDYENSIKEGVMALEGLCSIITKNNGTLGQNIKLIKTKYDIHPAMEQMISNLYGYSSDESGIRHEKKEKGFNVSFDEAKYILVLCSSTINYLLSISKKDLLG